MVWTVNLRKQPLKELAKMPDEDRERILKAITKLSQNPFDISKLDIKKLKGETEKWRLRSGEYRVIYEILRAEILIDVIKIGPRGNVYKK